MLLTLHNVLPFLTHGADGRYIFSIEDFKVKCYSKDCIWKKG